VPTPDLTAVVAAVLGCSETSAREVCAELEQVLRADRPDWRPRVEAVLARMSAPDDVPDTPEFGWFAALLGDLFYARTSEWERVGWSPRVPPIVDDEPPGPLRTPDEIAARYDVVVVGAGAGGGVAAWRLAAAGRSVLLVDRGGWPSRADLAVDHLRNPRASSGLDPWTGPRGRQDPRTLRGVVLQPGDGGWNANAMLLGGGTRVYGAQAWRFTPDDFRMASRYGVPAGSSLADWPISYADLEPHYDRIEHELGVSGEATGDPWAGSRTRSLPMPPVHGEQNRQREVLRRSADDLGWGHLPVPLLVNSVARAGRAACVRCAQCVGFACPVEARAGTHNTALPWALSTGNCDVLPSARAERLTTTRGRVTGVSLVGPGWRRVVEAGEVVVAAGAIESARLLLLSVTDEEPTGLGNRTDQVGRHLQGHVYAGASAVFEDEVVDLHGPGPSIATCDFRHGNPGVVGGGMLANEFVPTPASTRRHLVAAGFIPAHGTGSREGMERWARRLVRVVGPIQEVTTCDSRVRLDPCVRDGFGLPAAALSGGIHPEDARTQRFMTGKAVQWLTRAGATRVSPADPATPGQLSAGQHQAGTCRMGTDPASSVVDPWGRLWGHDNVRVVDASIHVTNGGVNPVLTVLAGASRIAEDMTG